MIEYCVNDKGNVGVHCPRCLAVTGLPITEEELLAWNPSEQYVQDAFPQLTPGQREVLLSGICEKCWNEIFPEEDEE